MKKVLFSLLGIFLLIGGAVLTACSNDQKASISVSSSSFVQTSDGYRLNISLNEEDENFAIVTAKVKNASDGRIIISNNYENIVHVTPDYDAKKDESIITITGVNEGEATIILDSWTGSADPVKVNIFVYSDITGLSQKVDQGTKNTQYVEKETKLELDYNRFLDFSYRPNGESNRKDITWGFLNPEGEYIENYDEGVYELYKFIDNELYLIAQIENNKYLKVYDEFNEDTITLIARSNYTEHETEVVLSVLDKFTQESTSMLFGRTSDAFADLDEIATQGKISVVRNDTSANEAEFYVKLSVVSKYDLEVAPYVSLSEDGKTFTEDYLIVTNDREVVFDGNRKDYVFKVKGINNTNLDPRSVYLAFDCTLASFDKTVRTEFVEVALTDVVDQIVVNTKEGQVYSGDRFEIYDTYVDNNGRGMLFNVQLKPETVLEGLDTFKVWLTPSADLNVSQLEDYISIVYEDGLGTFREIEKFERIAGSDTFEAYFSAREKAVFADNSEIFIKAGNSFYSSNGTITLSFISTQTEAVRANFILTAKKAPVHGSFVINSQTEDENTKYLATNGINQIEYSLNVLGISNANGLYLDYETDLPIEVSAFEFDNGVLTFSVSNTETNFSGEIEFTLKHKNGDVAQTNSPIIVKAFKPLTDATITLDNVNSYGVSEYTYEENSLSSVAMTVGAIAKLNFNILGECEVEIDEQSYIYLRDGVLTAGSTEIKDKQITVNFVGRNETGEEITIERTFVLEVYIPVSSLNTSETILNLIAKDSLSSEDESLSMKRITVNLRNDTNIATYRDLQYFTASSATSRQSFDLSQIMDSGVFDAENLEYAIKNAYVEGNVLSFIVEANSTNGYASFRDTLNLTYSLFGTNISASITLNVENAVRVQKVVWENEQDSIYLNPNSEDIKERSFVFVTTKQPQNAYNTNLTYVFVPDTGTQSNIVTIDSQGIVRLNSVSGGGTGYVYVLPSDSIKLVNGVKSIVYLDKTNSYRPTSLPLSTIAQNYETIIENGYLLAGLPSQSENYISYSETFKKIRLIVADGDSEETALRIYTQEQLQGINPAKHYVLMNNLTISSWTPLANISGSIRGYVAESDKNLEVKGSRSNIELNFDSISSFIDNILEGGKVRDLTFSGSVSDAFVAKTNNGTIQNITITAKVGTTIMPSQVVKESMTGGYLGAVVDVNNGTIESTEVLGAYVYTLSSSGLVPNYVGGIAGLNTGIIRKSYFEFYNNEGGVNTVDALSGYAGGLVGHSNGGTIEESYAYDYTLLYSESNVRGNLGDNAALGALIGKAENNTIIKNSFAVVNIKDLIGEDVLVEEISTTTIEDTYSSYKEEDGENPGIFEYKSDATFVNSDYWLVGEGIVAYVNGGYKHLKFYQEQKGECPIEILTIEGKSLAVEAYNGILMLHNITSSQTTLTQSQKNELTRVNTISIKDLFGEEYKNVLVTSNQPNIVQTTSTSIILKGTGHAVLTVYSNKSFIDKQYINVYVINTISDFKNDLTNNTISIQQGFTDEINYSIKNTIYLGSDVYELVSDEYSLELTQETSSTGSISLTTSDLSVNIEVNEVSESGSDRHALTAKLNLKKFNPNQYPEYSSYHDAIRGAFNNTSSIIAFKGARYIGISSEEITIYPSMISNLKVELETDDPSSDFIKFQIKNSSGAVLGSDDIENTDKEYIFSDAGIEKISVKLTKELTASTKNKYTLTISVVNDYRSQIIDDEIYTLYLMSNSGTATNENVSVKLTLKSQVVNHVDMTNYLYGTMKIDNNTLVYQRKNQISSVLTPGTSSFMVIGIDPTYANYEYLTVSAVAENGKSLTLTKLVPYQYSQQDTASLIEYKVDTTTRVVYQGNALKVIPQTHEEQYIFRVYVPTSIRENAIIPFVMSLYDKNGNLLNTKVYELAVSYQKPAEIIVNDNESSVIAKGGTAQIRVNVGKDQELDSLSLVSTKQGFSINNFAGPFEEEDGSKYYTATLYASVNAETQSEGNGNFQIKAQISRVINGVLEVTETRYEMTLADISIKSTTTDIIARVGITDEFDLSYIFDPEKYSQSGTEVNVLEAKRAAFKKDGYYVSQNDKFAINPANGGTTGLPITERLYVVNGLNSTKVEFRNGVADLTNFELIYNSNPGEGESVLSIKGKATTASSIRLRLDNYIYTDKNSSSYNTISNYYNITVQTYTDEELPDVIRTAEDFLKIQNNETPENYILLNDIELVNYKPFDTTMIASLDGNGYTINVTSFDTEGTGTLQLALFRNVADVTTLKNLRVNYYLGGEIDVDVSTTDGYSVVQIAGLALNNNGTITNCHVMSAPYQSNYKQKTTSVSGFNVKLTKFGEEYILKADSQVEMAGFVISNLGVITNSTVGGKSYVSINETSTTTATAKTVSLKKFSIVGQGTVSGFVSNNSGVIASSSVDQIEIINKSSNINFKTSGFALSNSGRISTSFIQGLYDNSASDGTSMTKCLSGSAISAKGYIAGFVSTNSGSINDSYSNILIQGPESESTSYFASGFVYVNTGSIETSYSGCKLAVANISQTNFSGVDIKGNSLNTGKITFSYYNGEGISYVSPDDTEKLTASGAMIARNPSSQTQFYGFTFASDIESNDGIWFISNKVLTLVAPNQMAVSRRVYQEVGDSYVLPYAKIVVDSAASKANEYLYGGSKNPIIIRNAEEFASAMGGADDSTNIGKHCLNGHITGSYRLVADIKLSDLNSIEGVAVIESTKSVFNGTLDGNGFEINNISLSGSATDYSVGLFSQIYKGTIVNLDLEFLSVTATTSGFVGGLGGLVYESNLINISAKQSIPGDNTSTREFGIKGANAVGGIAGAVFGNCKIANISISDPIVQATYYDDEHEIGVNFYTGKTIADSDAKTSTPSEIRKYFETLKNSNSTGILKENLKSFNKNGTRYMSAVSYAGGLFGYIDTYTETETTQQVFNGRDISDTDYKIYKLRISNTINIRAEIAGGIVGYTGINTNLKDAGITLSQGEITSNILSYNNVAGGIVGFSSGTLKQVFAEHDDNLQRIIEENMANYYAGSESTNRGLMDVYENTLSFDETVSYDYEPRYIGGLIGYARAGRLLNSYNKVNVITTVDNCIAGGIIGVIGTPDDGEIFAEQQNEGEIISSSYTFNEVYASSDVLGGKHVENSQTTHITGGLVGEVKDDALVTLSAVNAVNYFGTFNASVYNTTTIDTTTGISKAGTYSIIAKLALKENIKYLTPITDDASNELKHVGYVATYKHATGEAVILPYPGYTQNDNDSYFRINSLANINSGENGYIEMNGAFVGSGNWFSENWEHKIDRVYPTIQLFNINDFYWWDQNNTLEILRLMQNTSKEIRVRGLNAYGDIDDLVVDLSQEAYKKYFPIKNFNGKILAGWNANGERDISKIEDQKIIFKNTGTDSIFQTFGTNTNVSDVYIEVESTGEINPNKAFFVQTEVVGATFSNVTFEIKDSITITSDNQAGFIAPAARDTNFSDIKFIMANDKNITFKGSYQNNDAYFGLLAGEIKQTSQYSKLLISNIEIDYVASTTQLVNINCSNLRKDVYAGLLAGRISKENQDVNITGITLKNTGNPNSTDPATIAIMDNPITSENSNGNSIVNLYLGGYFGEMSNIANVDFNTEEGVNIKVSAPKFTGSGYVGGLVGEIKSDIFEMVVTGNPIKANVLYTSDSQNANLGGLFGSIKTGDFKLEANYFDLTVGRTEETNTLKGNVNLGGIAGNALSNNELKINIKTNGDIEENNIVSKVSTKSAGLTTANIGGLFGTEKAAELSLNLGKIQADIKIDKVDDEKKITSLNAGLISGDKSNGGEDYKIANTASSELTINGSIICSPEITDTANIGGLIGNNEGYINIDSVNLNVTIGANDTPITATKASIAIDDDTNNGINTTTANIGGYVGTSTAAINVSGGSISDASKIAVKSSSVTNVGGIVGLTTGNLVVKDKFTNNAFFAVENTTANETDIGGLAGQIGQINSSAAKVQIGNSGVDSTAAQVFVDSNFFVKANNTNLGGMIGKITSMTSGSYINNTIFGGAFKSIGTGSHVFGGIIGLTTSGVSGDVYNNSSFGDDIVTYTNANRFSSYTFGGIIGNNQGLNNQGLTLNTNYSLTTCNNDRLASDTDARGAIVGIGTAAASKYSGNLYSHVVNLATEDKWADVTTENRCTDVGYITAYESTGIARGYNGSLNDSVLATLVKNKVTAYDSNITFNSNNLGSKLNPVKLDNNQNAVSADTNGVSYFTFAGDSTIASQINVTGFGGAKRAIIGNARVLKYTNKTNPFIDSSSSNPLTQNEIISGMNVDINEEYDVTENGERGGLVNAMKGGTIYAVALSGKLSVGGDKMFNLAPLTSINGGLIDECNSSVDVIYRGAGKSGNSHPQVSGFVAMYSTNGNNDNGLYSIDVRNCYSTGQVSTYIDAQAFSFTDGNVSTFTDRIRVKNCYTISQIDQNDYTSSATLTEITRVFGGYATFTNCWYDVNGTEYSQTADITSNTINQRTTTNVAQSYGDNNGSLIANYGFKNAVSGWVQSKDYNYGYATRNFGYLKQSSYAVLNSNGYGTDNNVTVEGTGSTIEKNGDDKYIRLPWNNSTANTGSTNTTTYYLVPNAGKLAQITSGGKYVQMYDFDLKEASKDTTESTFNNGNCTKLNLGNFSGTYDGQEKTIKGGTTSLFSIINGTVKNLRITDVEITNYGGVLARSMPNSDSIVNNIVVSGSITLGTSNNPSSGSIIAGGIVNLSCGKILNCKNYVKIDAFASGQIYLGGICGQYNNSGIDDDRIINCINYAPIYAEANNSSYVRNVDVGGIIGRLSSGKIKDCGNTNSVLAGYVSTTNQDHYYNAGGIVGNINGTGSITNCYNTAMVKAGNKSSTLASYAGGIVGQASNGTFTNLYNSGVIEALGKDFKDIQNGYTISATSSQVTINISSSVNVYAQGIIGSNNSVTNYKNDGQIIRNGIYKNGGTIYTYSWDSNTKRSTTGDFTISIKDSKYTPNITGYDDLGYPTSFCVTAKRTVKVSDTNIVSDQTIISKTYSLTSTYYDGSKSTGEKNGSVNASTLINKADSSNNAPISITISGNEYQIATDKNSFNQASSGQYQTYTKEIDLKQIFGSSKFTDLYTLGYSFSVSSISSNKASIEVLPDNCTITDVKENGKANLTIGYSCSSTEVVSGISFNYTITASREDLSYSVNVSKNNIFEKQEGGNWKYILHIGGDTTTYEGNTIETCDYMIDGNEYVVNIGGVEYIGEFSYADKTLTVVNSTRITLSNNTTISYMFVQNEESLYYETEFTSESTQVTYDKEKTYSQTKEYVHSQVAGDAGYLVEGSPVGQNAYCGEHIEKQVLELYDEDTDDTYDMYMHSIGTYAYPISNAALAKSGITWLWVAPDTSSESGGVHVKPYTVIATSHDDIPMQKWDITIEFNEGQNTIDYQIYHYRNTDDFSQLYSGNVLRYVPINILYQVTESDPSFSNTKTEGSATYQKSNSGVTETSRSELTNYPSDANPYGMAGDYGTQTVEYSQKYTLSQISVSQNKTKASGNEVKQYEISDGTKVEKYVDDSLSNNHILTTSFNNTYSSPANNVTITYTTKTMSRNLPKDTGLSTSSLANNSQFIITSDITNGLRLENGSTSITGTNGTITVGSKTYTYTVLLDGYKLVNNNIAYYSTYDSNNDVYKITLDGVEYTLYTTAFEYTEYVVKNGETVTIDGVKYPSDSGISGYTREVIDDYTYFHNGSEVVYKVDTSGDNVVIRRNGTTTNYEYETFGVNVINLKGSSKTKTYTTAAQSNYDNYFVNQSAQTIYIVSGVTNSTNDYSSYINTVTIDGVNRNSYKYKYNIAHLSDDQEHTVEVGFKPSTSSSQSITGVTFKLNTAQGVIVKADINQGSALSTTIDKNISGNGYFINYYSNNSSYVNNLKGAFIKDLNFGGIVITKNTSVALGVYTIENAKICNVNTYGAISDISTSFPKHYFVSSSNNTNISNVSNYANYSAFNDKYAGADIGVKFVKESKNYGVIIGFDGADGVNRTTSGGAGGDGKDGQSIDLTGISNNGLIKAGNGGNGGRGQDGTIGSDSTSKSTTPTQGADGNNGGSAGSAGSITNSNGTIKDSTAGQNGYNGNKGHGGLWLIKLKKSLESDVTLKHNYTEKTMKLETGCYYNNGKYDLKYTALYGATENERKTRWIKRGSDNHDVVLFGQKKSADKQNEQWSYWTGTKVINNLVFVKLQSNGRGGSLGSDFKVCKGAYVEYHLIVPSGTNLSASVGTRA